MSYVNGIGSAPSAAGAAGPVVTPSVDRAQRTDPGSLDTGSARDARVASGSNDAASLSAVSGAVSQALAGSDVRSEKVAALQQSIAAGTYNVPASDVASKLMSALME